MGSGNVLIFPDDEKFLNPPSMLEAIAMQVRETEQTMPPEPVPIAKAILDVRSVRLQADLRVRLKPDVTHNRKPL